MTAGAGRRQTAIYRRGNREMFEEIQEVQEVRPPVDAR